MDLILSVLSENSDPVSKLSALYGDLSCGDDFIVARTYQDGAILLEQYRSQVDAILLEFGIDKSSALYREMANVVVKIIHESWKLDYTELSAQLFRDIRGALGLGTMAYRDTWEYSRLTHRHGYSKVRCYPKYTFEQVSAQYDDPTQVTGPRSIPEWLGTARIWSLSSVQVGTTAAGKPIMSAEYLPQETDIYVPHINEPVYGTPEIGEARFMGWNAWPTASTPNPKLQTVNGQQMFYDSTFGGYWVKPAGQTITCAAGEFVEACKIYGCNGKTGADTSFTIPSISGFVRMNPGTNTSNPMQYVPWQNGLSAHTHEIDPRSLTGTDNRLNARIHVETCHDGVGCDDSSGNLIHSGDGAPSNYYLNEAKFTADPSETKITQGAFYTNESDSGLNIESFPSHKKIPFIVYIGAK